MGGLTWVFFISLSIAAFCALMAGCMYAVKEAFFFIWKVKDEEADGLIWRFMRTGSKVLLSISVWIMGLAMTSGALLLIMMALYSLFTKA